MVDSGQNLSLREAAARLGISPLTLRRMAVYAHKLPYLKVGRRILFRPHDLDTFEQSCLVTGGRR
jgi:excisionase family DNA binding protein